MSSIRYDEAARQWVLASGGICHVLALTDDGMLRHRYLGPEADRRDHASPPSHAGAAAGDVDAWEYPARGPMVFQETVLAAVFGPADRDLHLAYAEHQIDEDGERGLLRIRLADRYHPLVVDLHYQVAGESGIFRRWAVIRNLGDAPVTLEEIGSFALYRAPAGRGRHVLHHLAGTWANEMNPVAESLHAGRKVLESRRGYTGHVHQPWFALTEEGGSYAVFGALEWSGNWRLSFDADVAGRLSVTGGMSAFDFAHVLAPGGAVTTPAAVVGAAPGGLDDAARRLHAYIRQYVLPRRPREQTLPVIFESWYTTFGRDMGAERLIQEARRAAALGVELFIITAGWYTTGDWQSHRGDWHARPELYPHGLEEVTDEIRRLGMRVGLWWEPEAVADDSDVYRDHPDWVYQFAPAGPLPPARSFILNLGRQDVYDHVRDDIFRLVSRYRLDYFRTDANRPWSALGDPSGASGPGRDLVWRHVTSYYRLLDEVRTAFPDLIIENCAGGGGRIDLGLLRRTDTVWISDNVDPLYRLSIFMGGTSFLPPAVCENWMVEWPGRARAHEEQVGDHWPQPDLDFRFRVCMMGHLGIGADVKHWPAEWTARALHHIARYKEWRRTIQLGTLYRLTPPPPRDGSGAWAAVAIVSPDRREAIAFCYRLDSALESFRVCVPGLEPDRIYDVELDDRAGRWQRSGRDLGALGVEVVIPARFSSALLLIG